MLGTHRCAMNFSAHETGAFAANLPACILVIVSGGVMLLQLLVFIGIALPAVWSAKPARRAAAAAVLGQILDAWVRQRHANHSAGYDQTPPR